MTTTAFPLSRTPVAVAALSLLAAAAAAQRLEVVRPAPGGPEPDSNMAFRLERTFEAAPGLPRQHPVATPLFLGLGDVADSTHDPPCDTGSGDGIVDPDDLLCDLWTSRQGRMVVARYDAPTASWQQRAAWRDEVTGDIEFAGDWTSPITRGEAYLVSVTAPSTHPVENYVTIVGSHDPSAPCDHLEATEPGLKAQVLLNVPYHVMFQRADEPLCGLARVHWADADGDGLPDTCDHGLFDPGSGARVTVSTILDGPGGADLVVSRSVRRDVPGGPLVFDGVNFELIPADALIAVADPPYPGRNLCYPHF